MTSYSTFGEQVYSPKHFVLRNTELIDADGNTVGSFRPKEVEQAKTTTYLHKVVDFEELEQLSKTDPSKMKTTEQVLERLSTLESKE